MAYNTPYHREFRARVLINTEIHRTHFATAENHLYSIFLICYSQMIQFAATILNLSHNCQSKV